MLSSLAILAVAVLVYFFCGFSWQGFAAGPAHVVTVAGNHGTGLRPNRFLSRVAAGRLAGLVVALLQMFSGPGGADSAGRRNRPLALGRRLCIQRSSGRLHLPDIRPLGVGRRVAGATGGELRPGARLFGCGRRRLHSSGGRLTAWSIACILGPRRGKYAMGGAPAAIPGHNAVLVLLGCFLALAGWFGLNCAGSILFAGAAPGALAGVAIDTILAAAMAALAAAAITRARFGRPDASLCANGWVAGLVASSAACAFITPAAAP